MIVPSASDDDQIRALAAEILARKPYAHWRIDSTEFLRQLLAWLEGLRQWLRGLADASPILYAFLVGALVLAALLLLAHLAYVLRVTLRVSRDPAEAPVVLAVPSFVDEAQAMARAGHFLHAAHCMQLAVIDVLLRKRLVELMRSDPNRTLRRRLQAATLADADRRDLLTLLDRLERQWFRDRNNERDLFDAWQRLHERVRAYPEPA